MRGILAFIAFVVAGGLVLSITGNPGNGLNSLPVVAMRIGAFLIGIVMLYQSYDAFRSALTGTQPDASAPVSTPETLSSRLSGIAWGVISLLIALTVFSAWVGTQQKSAPVAIRSA